jgi:hypothetical protein
LEAFSYGHNLEGKSSKVFDFQLFEGCVFQSYDSLLGEKGVKFKVRDFHKNTNTILNHEFELHLGFLAKHLGSLDINSVSAELKKGCVERQDKVKQEIAATMLLIEKKRLESLKFEEERKKAEAETAEKKKIVEEAAAKKKIVEEAAAKKKIVEEAAAKKKIEEEAAAKKKIEAETAAKKKIEEEAAAKKKIEAEIAAKKKIEEEAAAKKNIEHETTRKKAEEEESANNKEQESRAKSEELRKKIEAKLKNYLEKTIDDEAKKASLIKLTNMEVDEKKFVAAEINRIIVNYDCGFGRAFYITGANDELGNWKKATKLEVKSKDVWVCKSEILKDNV